MIRTPGQIERASMELIRAELLEQGVTLAKENEAVILRCIHASADFDYAANLRFTPDAVRRAKEALRRGTDLVTDTNMALAGISRPGLQKLGASAYCYMAEDFIAERAKAQETTRAAAAMDWAAEHNPSAVFAVGNAPTALLRIAEQIREGLRPALVIAVPVGFVNVVEGKQQIWETAHKLEIPIVAAMGRKGGSTVAAAILNALLYTATKTLAPEARGWH